MISTIPLLFSNLTAGTLEDSDFVVVNTTKTWTEAQRHCREHYTDLVTVRNQADNDKIHNLMQHEGEVWIGLYRDPQIYWSDGSGYSFSSWYQGDIVLGSMKVVCGVADLQQGGKWRLLSCEERFPFVCYSIPSENLFCISKLLVFVFVSFLTGLIKLSCRQHAAQRPDAPPSVFYIKSLSCSITTGRTVGFTKLYNTLHLCFVSLLVLCLS